MHTSHLPVVGVKKFKAWRRAGVPPSCEERALTNLQLSRGVADWLQLQAQRAVDRQQGEVLQVSMGLRCAGANAGGTVLKLLFRQPRSCWLTA